MKIAHTVFREYDIRGIAGREFPPEEVAKYEQWYGKFPGVTLTEEVAVAIGQAYGTLIRRQGGKKVVVGYELRPFAEELKDAFIEGVRKSGCDVASAGVALTPIIYFAVAFFDFDGGVNITGSHNVYFYNGFKLMKKCVWPLYGEELQGMREMIEKEDFETGEGKYEEINIKESYEQYVTSHVKLARKLKVVIDTGNGSAGLFAPDLFRKLGCEVVELYTKPDALFPNHTPDPEAPQNMKDLMEKVKEADADLGIGFDADGDRAGFIDEQGNFISADLMLLVFAKDALSRNPGKKILFDVKSTQLLEELIPQWGGVALMHRTGHAPIKEALRKDKDIIFAGEVSGHFYFVEDYFKIDDGLFAAARAVELASRQDGPFSSLISQFPKRVRTPEFKLPCEDEKKKEVVEKIAFHLQNLYRVKLIDGVRFQVSETGWGLVRSSNTSPYLTVRVEGATEVEVLKIKNILADELEQFPQVGDKLDRKNVTSLSGKLGWV